MEENRPVSPSTTETPTALPVRPSKKFPYGLVIGIVLVLAIIVAGVVLLFRADIDTTARVRDLFIILMALESMVIGAALIILIVQLATLINLLNNEVRPIIHSTNETVNTIKGTVTFLSDNLSEPVIKLNEVLAGIQKFFEIMRFGKR